MKKKMKKRSNKKRRDKTTHTQKKKRKKEETKTDEHLTHLCIKLCQYFKVSLQVCGQDGLDDEKAEAFELGSLQACEEIVLGVVEQ